MRTAIFTAKATTLIITTSEALNLVQMGHETKPIPLAFGENKVPVGPGVFKVFSKSSVSVTTEADGIRVTATVDNKDGGWPDPSLLMQLSVDQTTARQFFLDAKGQPAPR